MHEIHLTYRTSEVSAAHLKGARVSYIGQYCEFHPRGTAFLFSPEGTTAARQTDGPFTDTVGCENTKHSHSKTAGSTVHSRISIVYPHDCRTHWELPSLTREYRNACYEPGEKIKIQRTVSTERILLSYRCKVENL